MPTSDAPALNPDCTLKDGSEIEWLNSLSDENCTISLEDPKKRKRTSSEHDTDKLPSTLKEIALAQCVGTKRVIEFSLIILWFIICMVALCLSELLQTFFGSIRTDARA